jgi:Putative lumazine-binding
MKKILLITILTSVCYAAYCQQSAVDGVKKSVNTLFEGMKKGDTTLIKSVFNEKTILQSIAPDDSGEAVVSMEAGEGFVMGMGQPHTEVYDERITFGDIKIDGDLANVWAPYKFYLGNKFSHCGVDVFTLMKTNQGWKIIYIVDTRRKDACIN